MNPQNVNPRMPVAGPQTPNYTIGKASKKQLMEQSL